MGLKAELPEGVSLPPGFKIDEADPRFVALRDLATRERWSQKALSDVLGIEARRVSAEYERANATPAAPAPAAKPDFSRMNTAQKLRYALENPRRG
jgi:hypothetical protein